MLDRNAPEEVGEPHVITAAEACDSAESAQPPGAVPGRGYTLDCTYCMLSDSVLRGREGRIVQVLNATLVS